MLPPCGYSNITNLILTHDKSFIRAQKPRSRDPIPDKIRPTWRTCVHATVRVDFHDGVLRVNV